MHKIIVIYIYIYIMSVKCAILTKIFKILLYMDRREGKW